MLASPCYIVSDLHIGAAGTDAETHFRAFARSLPGRARSLVINGDLLDFWFEWRNVIPRRGFRTLSQLADLVDAGIDVVWVGGNHDWWGGDLPQRDLGVRFVHDAWEGTLAGWRARIEHGDGLRQREDRKYRALRAVIRHRAAIVAMRVLHPDWGYSIATRSSRTSRNHSARDGGAGLRAVAMRALSAPDAPELLVYGHTHVPALERAPEGGVYANAGSWVDQPTFLEVTPSRISLKRWTGSAEGESLHTVDRGPEEPLAEREELLRRV